MEVTQDAAWTELNFCVAFSCRSLSIALSRGRNGRCEFSALLFAEHPTSCFSAFPRSFTAALHERRPSVVTALSRPWLFMSVFMNFSSAGLSRALLAKESKTSPSWSTAR